MGPKKVLDVEISKNYYQIGNHHPQIHTRAKFHLKQIIFKFWDQIGPKKVLGAEISKNYYHIHNQHFCLFLGHDMLFYWQWIIVGRSVNILGHSDS